MPIYAYKCSSCGYAQDILQRMSDASLTECTACGAPTFAKQVTAAGFQLKGSGWYATDFKNGSGKKPDSTKPDTTPDTKVDTKPDTKSDTKSDTKPDTAASTDSKPATETKASTPAAARGAGGCAAGS